MSSFPLCKGFKSHLLRLSACMAPCLAGATIFANKNCLPFPHFHLSRACGISSIHKCLFGKKITIIFHHFLRTNCAVIKSSCWSPRKENAEKLHFQYTVSGTKWGLGTVSALFLPWDWTVLFCTVARCIVVWIFYNALCCPWAQSTTQRRFSLFVFLRAQRSSFNRNIRSSETLYSTLLRDYFWDEKVKMFHSHRPETWIYEEFADVRNERYFDSILPGHTISYRYLFRGTISVSEGSILASIAGVEVVVHD